MSCSFKKGTRILSHYQRTLAAAIIAFYSAGTSLSFASTGPIGGSDGGPALLPTGQYITATAAPGSSYQRLATGLRPDGNADADSAMTSALSPDGKTLLVLTSGFNTSINYQAKNGAPILFPVLDPISGKPSMFTNPVTGQSATGYNQAEFVFVYDVSSGTPIKRQQITIPDTFVGLAWGPRGERFYVSGGIDDRILVYKGAGLPATYAPDAPFIILNHNSHDTLPIPSYDGGSLANTPAGKAAPALVAGAIVAGVAVSRDGNTLVAANFHNASASIVDTISRKVINEVVFTPPGSPTPIGDFPYWVAVKSDPLSGAYSKAYITSPRDNQVVVLTGNTISRVIPVPSGAGKMALDSAERFLYVVCSNDDSIAVIDTVFDRVVRTISLARPGDVYKGAVPNSIAVGPLDERLYVTLGGENAVAVVDIKNGQVKGRIPTGWLPTSVSINNDHKYMFAINEKSNAGPNPGNTYYAWNTPYGISTNTTARNEYTWELEKSGMVAMPLPNEYELSQLSHYVDVNNGFINRHSDPMMNFLRTKIKHVIYIVNENRTFDQVLGDLNNGSNGMPQLTFFPQAITPNLHALAANYVTLDNFYDSSETSGVGWNWVMQGHTNDYVEKTQPVDYGNSNGFGFTYDWQGIVDNMNLGLPPVGAPPTIQTERITGILDPSGKSTILPGHADPSATEGANNLAPRAIGGYIWESVLRAGKTARNYGWQDDLTYYGSGTPFDPPMVRNPYSTKTLQSAPSTPSIQPLTDLYYRAFDQRYPDIFRIEEWQREYAGFVAGKNMPSLMTMTVPHDHTGSFTTAIEGLNTPLLELSDHDYAIGELVQTVTNSPYWNSTAIVMLEDDPQDGQDHVDAHRSIVHIISPYTKTHAVVHTTYFTTSALRTVEELLGVNALGFNDANAVPMSDAFTTQPTFTKYTPIVPGSLCAPPVAADLVPACGNPLYRKTKRIADLHDGAWWGAHTVGLDFQKPDRVNPQYYNALLEYGITGRGELPRTTGDALTSKNYDGDGDGK